MKATSLRQRVLSFARSPGKLPLFENLLRLWVKGREADEFPVKLLPNPYDYSASAKRRATIQGISYEFYLNQLVDWFSYFQLKDPAHTYLLAAAEPGYTVLDIGANIGITAFPMAKKVLPNGRVLAIEPNPVALARLRRHKELNPLLPVEILGMGLSDQQGELFIYCPEPNNLGMAHIVETPHPGTVTVPVTTLDALVADKQLERLDLIKIDVEGWEYHVFLGGKYTLSTFRPKIFFEADDAMLARSGTSWKQTWELLHNLDYQLFPGTDPNKEITRPETLTPGFHVDIWAKPR